MLVEPRETLVAVLRVDDLHPVALEHAREREHVADVVVDDQDLPPLEDGVRGVELLEHAAALGRQVRLDAVEEERGLVEQAFG